MSPEALDLLVLQELPGVGPVTVQRLVQRFGSAGHALNAPARWFSEIAGAKATAARRNPKLRADLHEVLERALAADMGVLTWTDPHYPDSLRQLHDPPPVLFLRGRKELLLERPRVTVVGSRRATRRGRDIAERLGAALSQAGVVVVSGLALGVDGHAHSGAVSGPGGTIAVLGTGPDVVYPAVHRALYRRVADEGLLVSEFIPGTGAAPHHFPRRNRILAALAPVTVVVEAGRRSGALITVDHALDLGRDVWSVPGPIDTPGCAGSNRLLADGARPLVSLTDFVNEMMPGLERLPTATDGAGDPELTGSVEGRVLAALHGGALTVDDLAAGTGLTVAEALAILTTLELHGEVRREPGMRFRRTPT
jgi:DNA processing protein